MQAGCVDEHDLEVVAVHNAADGVAGGLRTVRRDRHLRADQCIHQRRLPRVWTANETHEAGPEFTHRRSRSPEPEPTATKGSIFPRGLTFGTSHEVPGAVGDDDGGVR